MKAKLAACQAALEANDQRWRGLLDGLPSALLVVSAEGEVRYANPAAHALLGRPAGSLTGELFGMPLAAGAAAEVAVAVSGNGDGPTHRDGQACVAEMRVLPVSWPADGAEGGQAAEAAWLAELRDVTEQRRAAAALRESEALHRLVLENISDAVFVTDDAGRFTFICPNVNVIFGYSLEETRALGTIDNLLGGPVALPEGLEAGGIVANVERTVRDKAGREHALLITARRVEVGGGTMLYSCRDVSERSAAEQQVRLNETRFRALIENSHDAVALVTAEGRFAYASPATAEIMGWAPDELVGQRWVRMVHREDRAEVLRLADEVVRKPGAKVGATFRIRRRDGAWRWVEGTSHNLLQEPSVGAIVANYRDVTAYKLAEARQRALAQLGQRLSAVRSSAEAARVIFETADRMIGWDACYLDEYVPAENLAVSVLFFDTINGVRQEATDPARAIRRDALTERIMAGESVLMLREPEELPGPEVVPFGDMSRPSRSLMYVPVRYGNEVRAVLSFQSYKLNAYTPEDLETVKALADHCGGALDRLHAEAEVRRHNQELLTLNQIGRSLSELVTPEETLRRIHGLLGQLLDNRNLYIALYDAERQMISFPVYTIHGEWREPGERPAANGITEYVVRTRAPLLTGDLAATTAELGIEPVGQAAKSLVAVPMLAGESVLGVLCVQDYDRADAFRPRQRDLLFTVALQAAVALENARHYAAAQQEVAERRRAEAALREREQMLSKMLELLPVGVWLTDRDGNVQLENPAGRAIWGYEPDYDVREERAHRAWDGETGQPLTGADWPLERALARGQPTLRRILEIEAFDGVHRHVYSSVVPLRGEDDAIAGSIVVYEDITDRRRRERDLEALRALSEALREALREAATRADMLPILMEHVRALMGATGVSIMRLLPGGQEIEVEEAQGKWANTAGVRTPVGDSPTGYVIRTGQVFVADDLRQAPNFQFRDQMDGKYAGAALPLVAAQHTLGALWVVRPKPFAPHDTQLLQALADLAANALNRASLHEATQRRAEQLAAINALGRKLSETLDLPRIYAELCATGERLLPEVHRIGVSLYDAEAETISLAYALDDGRPRQIDAGASSPIKPPGLGTQSEVIRSGQPLIIGDLPAYWSVEGRTPPDSVNTGIRSGVYVPMLVKGRAIGVLHAQSRTPSRYTEAEAELLGLAANAAAIAIENARLFAETERRLHYVQAMHDIDRAITSSLDVRVTLSVLLDHATTQLEVDAAAVLLLNPHLQVLDHAASRGFRTKAIERSHVRLGEGLAGRAALERRPILMADLPEHAAEFSRLNLLMGEGFTAYYAVPLIAKGEVKGVLDVFHRERLQPTSEWLEFVQTLAGQAAVAIENAGLFNTLQRANLGLGLAFEETIEGWARTLDLRERGEAGHARRVTELAERLARALGMGEAELVQLRRGGLLHDVGLMGVPEAILNKPGPLDEAEWAVMRQHPGLARDLLMPMAHLRPALEVAYSHHERWDGTGYPSGLRGEQIPLAARVFAAADAWEALTSARPWRAAWAPEQVKAHFQAEAGKQFDPRVVEAVVRMKYEV